MRCGAAFTTPQNGGRPPVPRSHPPLPSNSWLVTACSPNLPSLITLMMPTTLTTLTTLLQVVGSVAIHGPDKIRLVFEVHRTGLLRLDVVFAYSLYECLIAVV